MMAENETRVLNVKGVGNKTKDRTLTFAPAFTISI